MIATFCILAVMIGEGATEAQARFRANVLEQAIQQYRLEHGKWPALTGDAVGYIAEGKKALFSPWGIPYQYILRVEKNGQVVPYVWTEREVNGKVNVYGKKPPEEKK